MKPLSSLSLADVGPVPPIGMLARKLGHHIALDPGEQAALAGLLSRSVRQVRHRALLADRDVPPAEIQVIMEGWACRFATLDTGKRRIVAFYLPGDVCDFDAFLMQRMDQPIAAIGPVRVASVSRQALTDLSRNQPRLSQALWWESMTNASIQRAWTINVGQRAADRRIAHLLCELHTRLTHVGLADASGCAFPLTQADLGDACALTSIHTNRALQELRRDGLLDLHAGALRIHDWARLAALGGFDPGYLHGGAAPAG
ncbi:MAG TPA: Crp/Fnr family transcriptional regulator [Sphingomonas sp.]|jgi:CRP-like cAMP-binding protein|nr:Crp/Fnr family transcriptional regulator [Sphingomonas sp.]